MNPTVTIVCYRSKTLRNGENPLMLRITEKGKRRFQSLGISVNPQFWNFQKNEPKRSCPNRIQLIKFIADKLSAYQEAINETVISGEELSATSLIEKMSPKKINKTVEDIFIQYITELRQQNRTRYADMYKLTMNSLLKFNGHLDIPFSEITVSWLKQYEIFIKGQGLSTNTLGTRVRHLRVIYNLALSQHLIKREAYPFDEYKVSRLNQQAIKRSIHKNEILQILNYKGQTPQECFSIDLFSFSYLTAGTNFGDLARMKKENLLDNRLVYFRKKTNKQICIPLQKEAINIINKYNNPSSPYLFPILNNFHKTELQKVNRIHKVITKVNKCLKSIGESLHIKINLTTYVARHSFATVLKRAGVPTAIISESLGHSSEKVTQIYLDSFDNEQIDEAMKNLI